jgi:hypothetical protein
VVQRSAGRATPPNERLLPGAERCALRYTVWQLVNDGIAPGDRRGKRIVIGIIALVGLFYGVTLLRAADRREVSHSRRFV